MSDFSIRRLDAGSPEFSESLDRLLAWESVADHQVETVVAEILAQVKARGDAALVEYTNRFDRRNLQGAAEFCLQQSDLLSALERIPAEKRTALEIAAKRVRAYHEHQLQSSWQYQEDDGTILGQQITPMERVGIYVPGGKASYPSSVLMNAIPAKVAGVDEVLMVVPAPDGQLNDLVLAAAAIAGVDRVYTVGGAQAVAALAYGTESIARVDKIVGPGNIFVASAKRAVFGQVAIDMIAGPSEILVICDGKTDPDWIAMDLLSQAEHDEQAQSILLCPDAAFLDAVEVSLQKLLQQLPRNEIANRSIADRGALVLVSDIAQAIEIGNRIAPEHLEVSVDDPEQYLPQIRHAGAIFLGRYTAEALGDYCAGPNHVLPTSGTARFSSPLGVYDFQKRSSIIYCSPQGADTLGRVASTLAKGEGLDAHARSAEYRLAEEIQS
ncbi:histidinol dehydrogenase [Microbulbifer sp. CAU 1566]|uniref:histidinol dehydrogenase n=1 Tax=Microbulbifer sp. CAU 1566 TaxID=2933269 RepID=UPI002004E0D5|nr:histidinol dehydrogenase [Microbulbifer sp. CAU 1566]MCK7595921.1 histidinol dehydrogenase [Microbulbifer sp. CAU 1566]